MKTGIISRITENMFRYQGWPTVCRDENGVLYCASSGFRLGHICPFGKNVLYKSSDGGETWSSGTVINDTCLDDRDAGLLYVGKGRMILTYFSHPKEFYIERRGRILLNPYGKSESLCNGMVDALAELPPEKNTFGSFVKISDDYGNSWGPSIKVPVSSPHGPLALPDGRLLYVGKEFHSGCFEKEAVMCFESKDGGETWTYKSTIDVPEGLSKDNFHEPHACVLPDGKILCGIRGQGNGVDFGFTVYTCVSDDAGETWTVPQATGICGSPPHFLVHSSGAVVLVYGRRSAPCGERARISCDGGITFGEEIVLGDETDTWDLGYPSSVELDDGSVFTAYYQHAPGDDYCSVLYTKWNI